MPENSIIERRRKLVRDALREESPYKSLLRTAIAIKDEGASKEELVDILEGLRVELAHHEDAILDVLDRVTGFCPPSDRLFNAEENPNGLS